MMGNYQVRFLGEKEAVMLFSYPTILSSMALLSKSSIGRIQVSIDLCRKVFIQPIGNIGENLILMPANNATDAPPYVSSILWALRVVS